MSRIKNYYDIDDLICEISNDIEDIAENEIKDKVIEMAQDSVQENVLDVYEPQYYKRRSGHNSDGLKDTWKSEVTNNNNKISLKVTNIAKSKNSGFGDLVENIEEGYGNKDKEWNSPRAFIKPLQEEIENSDEIEKLLLKSLKEKGYDIN